MQTATIQFCHWEIKRGGASFPVCSSSTTHMTHTNERRMGRLVVVEVDRVTGTVNTVSQIA